MRPAPPSAIPRPLAARSPASTVRTAERRARVACARGSGGLRCDSPPLGCTWRRVRRRTMAEAFLVGRILAGGYFLMGGVHHFTNTHQLARAAAMHGVPAPTLAVLVAG